MGAWVKCSCFLAGCGWVQVHNLLHRPWWDRFQSDWNEHLFKRGEYSGNGQVSLGIWRHQFLCTQQHYEFACRLSPINDYCNAWLLDTCWRASHNVCTAGISICSRASTSVPKVIRVMSSSVRYWRAPNICWEVWGGISVTIWIHIIWCTWAFHTKALESSSDSTLNAHNVKCCCHITTTSCVPHQEHSKAIPDSPMVYALQSPS